MWQPDSFNTSLCAEYRPRWPYLENQWNEAIVLLPRDISANWLIKSLFAQSSVRFEHESSTAYNDKKGNTWSTDPTMNLQYISQPTSNPKRLVHLMYNNPNVIDGMSVSSLGRHKSQSTLVFYISLKQDLNMNISATTYTSIVHTETRFKPLAHFLNARKYMFVSD